MRRPAHIEGTRVDPSSPDAHLAAVRGVDAGDDLDQGGFARAVVSQKGQHFTGEKAEVHADEGVHRTEGFADVAKFQYRLHGLSPGR
nr:hypothetical protein [Desulfosarcina cetonica]